AIFGPSSLRTSRLELYGLSVQADSGINKGVLSDIHPTTRHRWFHDSQSHQVLSLAKSSVSDLAYYLDCSSEYAQKLKDSSLQSIYFAKLVAHERLVGVLAIASL